MLDIPPMIIAGNIGENLKYSSNNDYDDWLSTLARVREGGGGGRGSMVEFEGKRRGMITTGEWRDPVSNMLHHV